MNNVQWKIWNELAGNRNTPLVATKGVVDPYAEWERKIVRERKWIKEKPVEWNAVVKDKIRGDQAVLHQNSLRSYASITGIITSTQRKDLSEI